MRQYYIVGKQEILKMEDFIYEIAVLLDTNKLDDAIKTLWENATSESIKNEIILLQFRYNSLTSEERIGLLSAEGFKEEKYKIESAITVLAREIGEYKKESTTANGLVVIKTGKDLLLREALIILKSVEALYTSMSFLLSFQDLEKLSVNRISVNSPGVWEFLGSLNPLQQFRELLKDMHERKKDKSYKNYLEKRNLELTNKEKEYRLKEIAILNEKKRLENYLLKNTILKERIELLKSQNISDNQIQVFIENMILNPILNLEKAIDEGEITELSIVENKEL